MERDQSEFNVALSALDVLNRLFTQCSLQAMLVDADGWFNSLLAIKRREKVYMNKDEIIQTDKFIESIHSKMGKFNRDLPIFEWIDSMNLSVVLISSVFI